MMNIMNPPADWSTLKKLIWLRGTPINGGEELTVSGTPPLSIPNSLGKPLKAWSVDLLPYQEGTGDPAPDNVRPIHGTDKLTITTAGKNLLKLDDFTATLNGMTFTGVNGVITVNGTATADTIFNIKPLSNGAVTTIDNIFSIIPGTNYVLNGSIGGSYSTTYWLQLLINGSGAEPYSAYGDSVQFSFTAQQIATQQRRLCIRVKSGTVMDNVKFYPMIRFASDTDATYEPYKEVSQTVLTLPQTVYTGTIGSEGGESRWGEVDLGTLNWSYNTTTWPNPIFYAEVSGMRNYATSMCEIYPKSSSGIASTEDQHYNQSGNAYLYIRDSNYTSVSDFKTAVSGYKFIYLLNTPTTFSVPSTTIPTPTGSATTWATAEDGTADSMEVTYVGKA